MNEFNVEGELVGQKNHILGLVNDERYEEALSLLTFSADLWKACRYAYKTKEIRERIRNAVASLRTHADHWKTREKWEKLLATIPY